MNSDSEFGDAVEQPGKQNVLQTVTPMMADAIDRQILMVPPEHPLDQTITDMGAVRSSCDLTATSRGQRQQASCVLVVDDRQTVGIFTERDIVSLTARGEALETLTVGDVMTSPVKTLQESAFQDIFAALFLFRRYRIRHLPIVNDDGYPVGIVTPASIRRVLRPANLLKMRRVADVMSTSVIHASPQASVVELAQLMAEQRVSCVVIVDVNRHSTSSRELEAFTPVGIVTERDIVQFQSLALNLHRLTAQDVMSAPLFLLEPTDSLWTAHREMQARRVRRLVVSWNWGSGLGIVTQTSLLKVFDPIEMYSVIESMEKTLHQISDGRERSQVQGNRVTESEQLENWLFKIETTLLVLADGPGLPIEQRQRLAQEALRSLQEIQAALGHGSS